MPRKTKKQKELENETKKIEKKASTKKAPATKSSKKEPSSSTAKKTATKKSSSTQKEVAKKEPVKKVSTKKASTKKVDAKKTSTEKTKSKKVSTKTTDNKKASEKKAETKKNSTEKPVEKKATTKSTNSKKTKATKSATKKPSTTKKKTTATKASEKKSETKKATTAKSATRKPATTKKKTTATRKKKVEIVEYYDLPYRYNQTVVKVLAQTPTNLFIYWDISDKDRKNFEKQYGDNFFETTRPILIVYNDTLGYQFEVEINDFANSWYLHVADSKCDYRIELGRRPIFKTEKLNVDYIYVTTSNEIESPNDRILFDKNQKMVYFRNVKTGKETKKDITSISFIRNMGKIYNIYDLYKAIYKDENIEEIFDLSNPSSGNPSSGSFSSSKFK